MRSYFEIRPPTLSIAGCDLFSSTGIKPHPKAVCGEKGALYSIKKEETLPLIQQLAADGSLTWKGKPLCFDPFSSFNPFFILEESRHLIAGVKNAFFESLLDDLELFLPARPALFILQGKLFVLRHPLYKWVLRAFNKEPLTALEEKNLLIDLEDDIGNLLIDLREKKQEIVVEKELSCEPLVILKRKAPHFANLYFRYGTERYLRDVCAPKSPFCREDEELFWEEVFKKSGFVSKRRDDTTYFVAGDMMKGAIKKLLQEGFLFEFDDGKRLDFGGELQIMGGSFEDKQITFDGICLSDGRKVVDCEMQGLFAFLEDGSAALVEKMPLGISLAGKKGSISKQVAAFLGDKEFFSMSKELADFQRRLLTTTELLQEETFLWKRLYPFQKEGVAWLYRLYKLGLGGIVADQMGLGKTIQILALIEQMDEKSTILIAVPKTLVSQWEEQIDLFCPHLKEKMSINIVSHHKLLREEVWKGRLFDLFCIDESHVIKNPKTQLYAAFQRIEARVRFCITGTPIFNRLEELWSQMSLAMPGLSDKVGAFIEEHRKDPALFTKKLSSFYLRRDKKQVAAELPSKEERWIFVDMGEKECDLYEKVKGSESNPLETLLRLRQIVLHPALYDPINFDANEPLGKTARIVEDLVELYENGQKVLLFSQFSSYLDLLKRHISAKGIPVLCMDGQTVDRQEVALKFKAEKGAAIMLLTLQVGGVGLNLQAADWVLLAEPWWNSAVEEQAIDRAHRIGRKAPLTILRYIAKGTLEEKMEELKEWKRSITSQWC